ncbi:hypothetical protein [Paraliobacillus salinarum]|uniref:hypothetical protein n=1 Tax=Paraliobacillus salinarum TaxID=1158996 RepID=UPI0015F40712|nr:hypothetical protein [Paraliobacillus salinarum]
MKKLLLILIALISVIIFTGCQSDITKLVYEPLSDEEQHLFLLTENNINMYEIKNLPSDKKYEILLTYEQYEGKEKVEEEIFYGVRDDKTGKKDEDLVLSLNYQDNKIRLLSNATSSGYDLEEDLKRYSRAALSKEINLELGKSYYMYYASTYNKYNGSDYVLGTPVTKELTNKLLEDNASTIFVKISFNEL